MPESASLEVPEIVNKVLVKKLVGPMTSVGLRALVDALLASTRNEAVGTGD